MSDRSRKDESLKLEKTLARAANNFFNLSPQKTGLVVSCIFTTAILNGDVKPS